ncbi:MAG: UDP-N-acetylglucosamine 1-carboxyvinyltransferase [Neomegalonema sp.]|nr:UDP-N-acetylglucosamine 1-carboxyvinyltransferase [Neomegalonema sp.]
MDQILVRGGRPLNGQIEISGAKNACLTLMPAALLTEEPLELTNAPRLADIEMMTKILVSLGAAVQLSEQGRRITIEAKNFEQTLAHYDLVRKMRASILVLGPILARMGEATVSLPGGCAIGARPVDLHLKGLEAMGAELELKGGYVHAKTNGRLKAAVIEFPFVSVGATENLMMAATLGKGTTVLKNAAREPEIVDLARCLRKMGAEIEGEGTDFIEIEGVDALKGTSHKVIADRIELGTFMLAPAITGGEVELIGGKRRLVSSLIDKLEEADIAVEDTENGLKVRRKNGHIEALELTTEPYPGFPTDLQAQMMALLSIAKGTSKIHEKIFENRFMHAPELMRMGADIEVQGGTAIVRGVEKLRGAPVMATDLRASVGLVLAGLAAEGETQVSRVYHLDRGYENLEAKLAACGADIERVKE